MPIDKLLNFILSLRCILVALGVYTLTFIKISHSELYIMSNCLSFNASEAKDAWLIEIYSSDGLEVIDKNEIHWLVLTRENIVLVIIMHK